MNNVYRSLELGCCLAAATVAAFPVSAGQWEAGVQVTRAKRGCAEKSVISGLTEMIDSLRK